MIFSPFLLASSAWAYKDWACAINEDSSLSWDAMDCRASACASQRPSSCRYGNSIWSCAVHRGLAPVKADRSGVARGWILRSEPAAMKDLREVPRRFAWSLRILEALKYSRYSAVVNLFPPTMRAVTRWFMPHLPTREDVTWRSYHHVAERIAVRCDRDGCGIPRPRCRSSRPVCWRLLPHQVHREAVTR